MKYFMVTLDNINAADELKVGGLLGENNFGFWHRLPCAWIVITPDDMHLVRLRSMITDLFGGNMSIIIVEFSRNAISANLRESQTEWFIRHFDMEFSDLNVTEGKN